MKVAVVGLGKIGLPLAVQFARSGHDVVGVDVNRTTTDTINRGEEPFPGEANLAEYLAEAIDAGSLRATTAYAEAIPQADAVVVVVPLFVDAAGEPDFAWMDSATAEIARHLTAGTLVSYETTLPVGTTRNRWRPALEAGSGLAEGSDFHLVFSPERVLTGRVFEDLRKYPKLMGAVSPAGGDIARAFYESVLQFDERPELARPNGVWDLGSAEAAEMSKLAETTYRDVNIGLANQFALFAQESGVDVYAVIEAANSQPYSHIHTPGIAVGGHCIPVYPQLYLYGDPGATVVRAAREHNASMPIHAVNLLDSALGGLAGRTVLVLGATYRTGVRETAFSGVFPVVDALRTRGATVGVSDPNYTSDELTALALPVLAADASVEGIIVQTNHDAYRALTADDFPELLAIVDGRHLLDRGRWQGVQFMQLGVPAP